MLKLFALSLFVASALTSELQEHWCRLPIVPENPHAVPINQGGRIDGGTPAVDGEFPFVNELILYVTPDSFKTFTGSFLSLTWTITALSPITQNTNCGWLPLYVKYGAVSQTSPNRKTANAHAFYYWTNSAYRIDMAVIQHDAFIFSQYVGVIQLPSLSQENYNFNNWIASQAGFGNQQNLKYHLLNVNSNASGCTASLPLGFERMSICSQSYQGGTSPTAIGDKGSPLFVYDTVPTLIGIYWNYNSGDGNIYATRVSSFLREISDKVGVTLRP